MQKTIMVRYTTEQTHATTNEALIHAVFDELRARAPDGIRYTSYHDGATFVHIATLSTEKDSPLSELVSFAAFQKALKGRCVESPVVTELAMVDSYQA